MADRLIRGIDFAGFAVKYGAQTKRYAIVVTLFFFLLDEFSYFYS